MSCSRLKKNDCLASDNCEWENSKCRKKAVSPKRKACKTSRTKANCDKRAGECKWVVGHGCNELDFDTPRKATATPKRKSCKSSRKSADCKARAECKWIVGHGCNELDFDTPRKATATPKRKSCKSSRKSTDCKARADCKWIPGQGCNELDFQTPVKVPKTPKKKSCKSTKKMADCNARSNECKWVPGQGCMTYESAPVPADFFDKTPSKKIAKSKSPKRKSCKSSSTKAKCAERADECRWVQGIGCHEIGEQTPVKAARGCVKQSTKKYNERPSPPFPANECCDQVMEGNDGKKYQSTRNSRGICQWKLVEKKNVTGYFLFMKDVKDSIRQKYPDYSIADRSTLIGEMWRSLSKDEQLVYKRRAEELNKN